MPDPDPAKKPVPERPRPAETDPLDLPLVDDTTDALELGIDLDADATEPIGELPIDDVDRLLDEEAWVQLETDEPTTTPLASDLDVIEAPAIFEDDDLEDFATQEELPIFPWKMAAELLELGLEVTAILDLTAETSTWTCPEPLDAEVSVTVRLRMLDLPVTLAVTAGPESTVRLGRDAIGGRVLVTAI